MNHSPRKTKLVPPNGEIKVLLHSCCAPCSGELMETLVDSSINFTIFFYNPNIHPRDEYEIRKNETIRFAKKMNIPVFDGDYDRDNWFKRAKGVEGEPERGKRCTMCFDMRFERSALFAAENGFKIFTSSLGMSRRKDMSQVNQSGMRAASHYPKLLYWNYNWRKGGGSQRMYEISKREQFYKQEYCGCIYSLRDTNLWRAQNNKDPIERRTQYYGSAETEDPPADQSSKSDKTVILTSKS